MIPPLPAAWRSALGAETGRPYFRALRRFIDGEYATRTVYPASRDIFRTLALTAPEQVRAVVLGQDPYHGEGQAHGLAFSVRPGTPLPPSLRNIYRALEEDTGIEPPAHGCLDAWAGQGVLLLNTILTVRAGEAGSHARQGWETFTDSVLTAVNARPDRVIFLLWGNAARSKRQLVDESRHFVIAAPHPSPLSAHRGFFGSRPFSRTNAALREAGVEPVDWRLPATAG